jgi:hypothetical protein
MASVKLLADCRFSNKLVPDKGLALSVYDVWTAEDGKVTWGNGMMYYKGRFSSFSQKILKLIDSIIQIDDIRPFYRGSHYGQNHLYE